MPLIAIFTMCEGGGEVACDRKVDKCRSIGGQLPEEE